MDPKAQLYYSWSPYNLSADNPIANSDPSGASVTPPTSGSDEEADLNEALKSAEFRAQYEVLQQSKNTYSYKKQTGNSKIGVLGQNSYGTYNLEITYKIIEEDNMYGAPRLFSFFEETYHSADYERGKHLMTVDMEIAVAAPDVNGYGQLIIASKGRPLTEEERIYYKAYLTKTAIQERNRNYRNSEVAAKVFAYLYSGAAVNTTKLSKKTSDLFINTGNTQLQPRTAITITNSLTDEIRSLGVSVESNYLSVISLIEETSFDKPRLVLFNYGRTGKANLRVQQQYKVIEDGE